MLHWIAPILSAVAGDVVVEPSSNGSTFNIVKLSGLVIAIVLGLRVVFRLGDGPRNNLREQLQERDREADLKNRDGPPRFNG